MDALPFIAVNISQPGDKGEFHIAVSDAKTKQVILTNRLKEDRSAFEYLYNSRLIEGSGKNVALVNDDLSATAKRERLQDMIRYGQRLYQDLFGHDDTLKQYMKKHAHFAKGACIVLRLFDTASELWNIPWEYIHDGTEFLGLNPKFPILRYLVDTKPVRPMPNLTDLPNPLRILFVISNPRNAQPLNVEAEINRIQRAIKPASDKRLIEIEYVEQATLQNLENALAKKPFHILHYSGHGVMTARGSMLVMEDDKGMSLPVSLDQLAPIISKGQDLRLIFLSACKAGNINETKASSGIATGLMRVVPAVVAMQFSILDTSASKLAEAFYGQIGNGATLEEALFASRKNLYDHNEWLGDWGVPALYIQKPNVRLVDVTKERKIATIAGRHDLSTLPEAETFSGRREEQIELRKILKDGEMPFVYIWGLAGVGKSALVHQILKRPGQDVVINDVLILRCDQSSLQEIVTTFQQWIAKHFPNTQNLLANLPKAPRETIRQIAEHVKGKKLVLVLDHVDSLMVSQEDRYWRFKNPLVEEFFIGLARADWSILTIMTARFLWHYTTQIPENAYKDIHLSNLAPTDFLFIVGERDMFKKQKGEYIQTFANMVGGHPATIDYISRLLASRDDLLADPRLKMSLVNYWHKSFLEKTLALLSDQERELLKVICIHDSIFSPDLLQRYGELPSPERAAYIMVAWEMLSLADFIGTDQDDVAWYSIPNLVRTYLTSSMHAAEKNNLHARFADGIRDIFYQMIIDGLQDNKQALQSIQSEDEFTLVLRILPQFLQHPNPDASRRYQSLTFTWQTHFREAGLTEQANKIAMILIGILHDFGDFTGVDDLIKTVRKGGKLLSPEVDMYLRYWSAVRLIDQRDYSQASKILDTLEGQTRGKAPFQRLYANVLERQGEIYRGTGDTKRTEQKWVQTLDEYEKLRDRFSTARLLFYFAELSYYAKNLDKVKSRLEKAVTLLYQDAPTGPALQLEAKIILYLAHLARLENKGDVAIKHYTSLCRIGMSINDPSLYAQGLEHIGYYYGLMRQYEVASTKLLQALDVYEQLDDQMGLSLVLMKLAVVQDFNDNPKEAYAFCQRSHRIAQQYKLAHLNDVDNLLKRLKRKAGA